MDEIGLYICAAYSLLFFVGNIILQKQKKHDPVVYIEDGKLRLGRILKAGGIGLIIPVSLTVLAAFLTSGPCEDERGSCASFSETVIVVQVMIGLVAISILAWFAGKFAWMHFGRSLLSSAASAWKRIWEKFPIRW